MKFGKYACIGLGLDVFDWVLVGMIPGIGDVVDLVTVSFWVTKLGPIGLLNAAELVPFGDVLPMNVVMGMIADSRAAESGARVLQATPTAVIRRE